MASPSTVYDQQRLNVTVNLFRPQSESRHSYNGAQQPLSSSTPFHHPTAASCVSYTTTRPSQTYGSGQGSPVKSTGPPSPASASKSDMMTAMAASSSWASAAAGLCAAPAPAAAAAERPFRPGGGSGAGGGGGRPAGEAPPPPSSEAGSRSCITSVSSCWLLRSSSSCWGRWGRVRGGDESRQGSGWHTMLNFSRVGGRGGVILAERWVESEVFQWTLMVQLSSSRT